MKTGKRLLSILLCLIMLLGTYATSGKIMASAAGYSPDAAITYAKVHWNDNSGDCQDFVKACLKAGGVTISASGVASVKNALVNGGYGTLNLLSSEATSYTDNNGNTVPARIAKTSSNYGKVKVGDPLFTVCSKCGWTHTVIMGGTDSSGYITVYAHNSAKNNKRYYADCKNKCAASKLSIYSVSMNVSSTPCTTHTKGEYQYYWAAHPHYKCYKCSKCGEVFNTTETTYVSSCSTCSSHTHQKGAYQYYWAAHPHYKCYKCTVCGETYNTSETTYLSSCSSCTAKPVVTVTTGTSTTNTKISFTKNSMASQHDIHIYYSDGTRYKVIGAVNSPYSLVLPKGQFSIYAVAIVEGNQIWSDRSLVTINDPTFTLTINFYSNYADKSASGVLNTVGADKNVVIKTTTVYYGSSYPSGLWNYSTSNSGAYLGRTGYTSTGNWNTKTDGSGYSVNEDTAFTTGQALAQALGKDISQGNATVNVYPEWNQNKLTVNYYSNYADKSFSNPLNAVGAEKNVLVRTSTFNYADSYQYGLHDYSINTSATYLGRTGYTCTKNWNTKPDGSGLSVSELAEFSSGQDLAQALGKDLSNGNATVNLYPEWKNGVDAPVTHISKTRYEVGETITFTWERVTNASISNYWLEAYKTDSSPVETIVFEINNSMTKQLTIDEPGEYIITAISITPEEMTSSPNNWQRFTVYTTHSVMLNSNYNTFDTIGNQVPTDLGIVLPELNREGYVLSGWNTQANGYGINYDVGSTYKPTGDITLYAIWEKYECPHLETYSTIDNVIEPTCTSSGSYDNVIICESCGETVSRETVFVDPSEHIYTSFVNSPTCSEQGFTIHTCSCGKKYIDNYVNPLGHSFTNYIYNDDATTEKDGTETAKCDRCDETDTRIVEGTKLHVHSYSIDIESPNCVSRGYTAHTCSCGDYYEDNYVDALGHSFANYVYNNDATTEADGTETAKCDRCDETDTRVKVGTKLPTNPINPSNPTASAKLNAKSSTTVDYRSKVNITATASGVPDGYFLAIYSGNTLLEKGTKDKVSYTPKDSNNKPAELKADTTYTVKVVDGKNTVQKDSNGKDLTANVEIKVKQGFFDKLIAFFKGLFGLLPTVEIKP